MTKISRVKFRANLLDKKLSLTQSPVVKRIVLFGCLLTGFGLAALFVFYAQSDVMQDGSPDALPINVAYFEDEDFLADSSNIHSDGSALLEVDEFERGRRQVQEIEYLASAELTSLIAQTFGPERLVAGRVHYDLSDIHAFNNQALLSWRSTDGLKALLDDSCLSIETFIDLQFADPRTGSLLSKTEVQRLAQQICDLGLTQDGQRATLFLSGPNTAQLFNWQNTAGKVQDFEEGFVD